MLGKLGDFAGLLKSAKEMQANLLKMQEELASKRYTGDAGGGGFRRRSTGAAFL